MFKPFYFCKQNCQNGPSLYSSGLKTQCLFGSLSCLASTEDIPEGKASNTLAKVQNQKSDWSWRNEYNDKQLQQLSYAMTYSVHSRVMKSFHATLLAGICNARFDAYSFKVPLPHCFCNFIATIHYPTNWQTTNSDQIPKSACCWLW